MITFDELNIPYLPSGRLWKQFAPPIGFGRSGGSSISQSGNPSFGFFDNFHIFQNASAEGPYRIVVGAGCTVAQIADTATDKGLVQLFIDGNAVNDEAILQWGRGLGAPFQLANNDLVFETRLRVSAVTAAKWSWAVGLGVVGAGATDGMFADGTGLVQDTSFLGFVKLSAQGTNVDGAYRAQGQAYQDGSNKTKLSALATLQANVFVKLGFRYRAMPQTVEWYVDGVLAGSQAAPARLTQSEIRSPTFPGSALLTPVIAIKDVAGNAPLNMQVDWLACAQNL
jgi:hypothetical protein